MLARLVVIYRSDSGKKLYRDLDTLLPLVAAIDVT